MPDICVTVPKNFTYDLAPGCVGMVAWAAEGDLPGQPWSGTEWDFTTWGNKPDIQPGERVYVACQGRLRGYAPLVRLKLGPRRDGRGAGSLNFIRGGGAVAVTIPQEIVGFRGWRYRWWDVAEEVPFPDWLGDARRVVEPRQTCESVSHRRPQAQRPRAAWCALCRSPGDNSILMHRHICTQHANSERRFGHATVVPIAECPGRAIDHG